MEKYETILDSLHWKIVRNNIAEIDSFPDCKLGIFFPTNLKIIISVKLVLRKS